MVGGEVRNGMGSSHASDCDVKANAQQGYGAVCMVGSGPGP